MLHVAACILAILRHVITKTIQRKVQYSYCWCIICTLSSKCQDEKRGLLLSTFCSKIFRDTWNIQFLGVQYWKLIVDVSVNTFLIGYISRNYVMLIANPPLDLYRKICWTTQRLHTLFYAFPLLLGLDRQQVYVPHYSGTKKPPWLWLCEGNSSSSDCHLFPAPNKNLCCPILEHNNETETTVARWLLTQGTGWCQQRKEKLVPWYDKYFNCSWGFVEKWRINENFIRAGDEEPEIYAFKTQFVTDVCIIPQ